MFKAPAGGLVSPVNGQFYNGGEFLPDHGKSCGRGKHAVTRADFDEVNRRAALQGWELIFSDQYGDFRLIQTGRLAGLVMFRAASLKTLAKVLSSLS